MRTGCSKGQGQISLFREHTEGVTGVSTLRHTPKGWVGRILSNQPTITPGNGS